MKRKIFCQKPFIQIFFQYFFVILIITITIEFFLQVDLYGKIEEDNYDGKEVEEGGEGEQYTDGNDEEENIEAEAEEEGEGEEEEEELYIEIDPEVEFEEVAKGKSYVTFAGENKHRRYHLKLS